MNRNWIFALLLLILAASFTALPDYKDPLPCCLRKKINALEKQHSPDLPTQITLYMYHGKKAWLLTMPCCDQFNELYDSHCNLLCAPSGGFTGRGDGKCTDFKDSATLVKIVWRQTVK